MEVLTIKPGRGGHSKQGLYTYAAKFGPQVIDFLVATMADDTMPPPVRVSAANKLIDKILANLSQNNDTLDVTAKITIDIDGLIGLSKTPTQATASDPAATQSPD